MAFMANDLFNKRQRLIQASQARIDVFEQRATEALDAEYRAAEAEYAEARAAFARVMKTAKRAA